MNAVYTNLPNKSLKQTLKYGSLTNIAAGGVLEVATITTLLPISQERSEMLPNQVSRAG